MLGILPRKNMDFMKTIAKQTPLTKAQFLAGVINSIKGKYPTLRQDSKPVTFALQYSGTPRTLVTNSGFDQEEAQGIYDRYHNLYKVSAIYAEAKKAEAAQKGYAEVAFGLRVRTPLMAQVLWGSSRMPTQAKAEGRTLGNALSQSYGLLNNRAANEFMQKVWASRYRYDVLPCAQIHDAQYYLVRDDIEVVEWVNLELIKSMQWQELPEIQHDLVKLGGEMDLFWPDWSHPITLPNDADQDTIKRLCQEAQDTLLKEAA